MSNQFLITTGTLIGGLGLFLLAVGMITDGLRLAAGSRLKDILGASTSSPLRGTLTGISITAIVQSSSAVTVAAIGFVNAGLITLYQALGIIFGTNVGTTVTGWLVAIIGFQVRVESFALPLVGVGMAMRLIGGSKRYGHLGTAIAGFGLFFIGIEVLKDSFEGIAASIDLQKFTLHGFGEVFVYLGVGFVMTVLTQSSSAAIAITLTAATSGVLGLYAAAAMVIGANVGTTSTAAISVIGATPNAKRVAAAHVIFNLSTAVVALSILPALFWITRTTSGLLGLENIPAITLALFHTVFNVLGLILMWPISGRLVKFLQKRFVTREEIESHPRYLDKNIAASPDLAVDAVVLELARETALIKRLASAVLNREVDWLSRVQQDIVLIRKLSDAISQFVTRLGKAAITEEVAMQIAKLLRAQQHLLASVEQASELSKMPLHIVRSAESETDRLLLEYRAEAARFFDMSDMSAKEFSLNDCEAQLEKLQSTYEQVKTVLLSTGAKLIYPVEDTISIIDENSHIRRMARQVMKAVRDLYLLKINAETNGRNSHEHNDTH